MSNEQQEVSMNICEIKSYMNEQGMRVSGLYPLDGSAPEFHGSVAVPIGGMQLPVEFDFPAGSTLEQCFKMFIEVAQKAAKEQIEEMRKKQQEMERERLAEERANAILPAGNIPRPSTNGWSLV